MICKIGRQIKWATDAKNKRKSKSRKYSRRRRCRTTFRIRCASMGSTIPRITDGRQHTKASRARARERAIKAHSRRPDARHHNTTGHQLKKLVKHEVRTAAAAYLIASYTVAAVRACGLIGISRSFGGYDIAEALDRLICLYGRPNVIKSDNGSEFRSRYMEKWSKERGITLEFTSPGKPTENG